VHFGGELAHGMRACLRSRIALRVLYRLHRYHARDGEELYRGARELDFSPYIDPTRTLAVSATQRNSALRHTGFVAQRVKDAIVDQQRELFGNRPDVARDDPDVHVTARIVNDEVELHLDLAGRPLHRRGYRTQAGEAPLKEHLAAAVLRLSGWRPGTPLWDPLCGSGTFCIEAAAWAAGLPAGGKRRFGFQRWRSFDAAAEAAWELERERAKHFGQPVPTAIRGSDNDADVLRMARDNASRAGVDVELTVCDLFENPTWPEPGTFVVTNPPYGVRLSQDAGFRQRFGQALGRMRGCQIAVITPDRELAQAVGRKPATEHTLYNGDLECRLFGWKIP